MSTQKLEYDASLCGRITLPGHVSTYHYAGEALQEIKSLIAEAQLPPKSKLIFQTLPKHMRRRAMSHYPKRLPRKHRAAHKAQMGKMGSQPVDRKRPSRKYRRRPGNLLREYVRRQQSHIWLETHIWHAKRFHMIDRWGYRLPYASCDKTYRACYRASAEHCLLQDISYFSCVQLQGSLERLRLGFARLTSPECGLGITARTFVSGRREGSIQLFADGQYPLGALQRASFMWRPKEKQEEQTRRTLWLWLHPAAGEATIAQLISVFDLKSTKQQKLRMADTSKEQEPLHFWTHTKAFERHKSYANENDSVHLLLLKQEFNRFRLTGPRSQHIISSSLRTHNPNSTKSSYCKAALQLSSPSALLSNLIIGVNVVDPRLQRPRQRTKATTAVTEETAASSAGELLMSQPDDLSYSALWQPKLRELVSQQMLTTQQYDQLRQLHAVVPGEPCSFEKQMQKVPLMLIQRPGSQQAHYKRPDYASGWDVIAPARYGMPLWLTLIMWGALPGGLLEHASVAREAGVEHCLPDTVAGLQQASLAAGERRTRFFRLPPNKRCNYRKLAVVSPFLAPWQQLVRDWSDSTDGFFVLRDRVLLQRLDECLRRRQTLPEQLPDRCIIQIELRVQTRGHLKDNALICLPKRVDWKRRWQQLKHEDHSPVHSEPLIPDLNERLRRDLRLSHKCLLKRLRAGRVREKRRLKETSRRCVHIQPANTAPLMRDQLANIGRLWLPTDAGETLNSVRHQCSREVFGYVSSAGFSFVEATVCAVGYITLGGLRQLLEARKEVVTGAKKQPPICLVRNADSREYRFARFQINLNVSEAV